MWHRFRYPFFSPVLSPVYWLEKSKILDYGTELPSVVRDILTDFNRDQTEKRTARESAVLVAQAVAAILLVFGLGFHVAQVGLVGLAIIILATTLTGVTEEHRLGKAFEEALPFTALLVVFFGIVAVIEAQHLFHPVTSRVLALEGDLQTSMMYLANGFLSMISDNVFVATVYISEVKDAFDAGVISQAQLDNLAVAINTGTNIPSVATPNGQAAFLFLLTSALAPLIRLSYGRMVILAIPYTIVMTIVGLLSVMYLMVVNSESPGSGDQAARARDVWTGILVTQESVSLGWAMSGLPLAVEFGRQFDTVGFDVNQARVDALAGGHDATLEVDADELTGATRLSFSTDPQALANCNVFIVTVPTPIDRHKRPDLTPLEKASDTIGAVMQAGAIVIYESTVYPGATEEVCVPHLEAASGLKFNEDFFAGYSPERINPGDKTHRLPDIVKVTSGSTPEVAEFVDQLYRSIIRAGTHKASCIKVAEAAKVIENTQRDVNIALINELALIFNRLDIDTEEILLAAGTKWNFLGFRPGLVGGHCIGVDPYYLTHKSQEIGYHPEMILAGRRINDNMGLHVAAEVVRLMVANRIQLVGARILVLGLAFKENCPDVRNTKSDRCHQRTEKEPCGGRCL